MLRKSIGILLSLVIQGILLPVQLQAVSIEAESMKTAIINHVEKAMPWPPGSMRVDFLSKIVSFSVPQESVAYEVQGKPNEDFIGDSDVTVRFLNEGTVVKEENIRIRMNVLMDVVVTDRPMAKNQVISSDDVQILKKWMKRIPENRIAAPEEVIGKAMTMSVRQNIELTRNMIKTPLLIKKGKVVRILFSSGNLSVAAIGVSEEDGMAESMVRVKNITSNKTVYARVAGDSLVRVEF